jgi:uncharacterized membrane protein YgdD (TMEM256/DUF423 family)
MIPKIVHIFACFYGATAVILGAFAAHGLKSKMDSLPNGSLLIESFKTGAHYQLLHAIVLLVLAFQADKLAGNLFNSAVICFMVGIFLFSGSIYILSTRELLGIQNVSWLGPITPLGGLLIITGWVLTGFCYNK